MKKLILLILFLTLAGAGFLISREITSVKPGRISSVEIRNLQDNSANTYEKGSFDAVKLAADLGGAPAGSLPDAPMQSFRLTLRHALGFEKAYEVFFSDKQEVYVLDKGTGRLTVTENPLFFNSHEGFDSLYPGRKQPSVVWSATFGKLDTASKTRTWSFRRRDGSWSTKSQYEDACIQNKISSPGASMSFSSDNPPDAAGLEITDNSGHTVARQALGNVSIPVQDRNGIWNYKVTLDWTKPEKGFKGTFTYIFTLAVELPVTFEFPQASVEQGQVVTVKVHNVPEGRTPELRQKLFDRFVFYRSGNEYTGFLPTGYAVKPGVYTVEYGLSGGGFKKTAITVKPRNFLIQQLTVDKGIEASTRNEEASTQYDKYFTPVRRTSNDAPYYSEPFIVPAKGKLSTEYGETRYVNGSPTSYRHSGIDIAAPKGTPVYAANRGKVVLSMFLIMTGNTIVIDHGQGLFSVYFHMNERTAKQGEIVERGRQIGTVGTTGFSTGPHLHFTMSYFERNVEPGWFLAGKAVTQDNYEEILNSLP